jgi:four helix bundle protein
MQRFIDLKVWQEAHKLVLEIYKRTEAFPKHELYGLTSQLRRAAASIPANIAEGTKRRTSFEYARFLNIAEGFLAETEYFLILDRDLGYIDAKAMSNFAEPLDHIARMLNNLRASVESANDSVARRGSSRSTLDARCSTADSKQSPTTTGTTP